LGKQIRGPVARWKIVAKGTCGEIWQQNKREKQEPFFINKNIAIAAKFLQPV